MADYRAAARQAAQRYGLDPNVFLRQINQESGFNPTARSPAGAIGIAQIMPATARGWGVDPTNPIAALNAAAKNMKGYVNRYGSYRNALVAYNAGPGAVGRASLPAETTKYIDIILNGKTPPVSSATPPAASSPISAAQSAEQAFAPITLPARPVRQITAPTAPGFAAQPTTPTGARATPSAPQIRTPRLDVNAALNALAASSSQAQSQPQTQPQTQDAGSTAPARGGDGSFTISGPNPGRLRPHLTSFANKVADQLGMNLVGLDGSTHSKYTTTGNVSQHYTGNATDIFTINGKSLKQHPGS
jgi:hypothetical protein